MNWRDLLAQRESAEHFVVEGKLAVERLLASNYKVIKKIEIGHDLTREEASSLLGFQFHRGVLAIAQKPPTATLSDFGPGPLVVLSEIADPGNLGTIIRNTAALGGSGVIIGKGTSPFNAKAIRASAGNLFRLPIRKSPDIIADLQTLRNERILLGTDLGAGALPLTELPTLKRPAAIIFGPEDFGITDEIRELCHYRMFLPMARSVDSLNVACSSAIFLHELS